MRYLDGEELIEAKAYIDEAAKIARNATCERSKCGSLIVKYGTVIGRGFNSPAGELESQRRCHLKKDSYSNKVTDKTCCVHAEQRAIMNALAKNPNKLEGSRLYFARIDSEENLKFSGDPYCTICSKMSLDVGIFEFVLYRKEGICVYETGEYNDLSYKYTQ